MKQDLENVAERIVSIYRRISPGGQGPKEDGRGELDSMAFLEFVALIEEEFDILIATEEVTKENFATTQTTAAYVLGKLP